MKTFSSKSQAGLGRRAFTLVEMLVTMVVTLLVLLALVNAFQWIGERVALSRASMEMAGTLRGVGLRLQSDLDSITVPVRPWPSQNSGLGYFEYIEGPMNDSYANPSSSTQHTYYDPISGSNVPDSILGDRDDFLGMTIHSTNEPFVGRLNEPFTDANSNGIYDAGESFTDINGNGVWDRTTTSYDAEVVWWIQHDDANSDGRVDHGELVLRRRLLLIRPDLTLTAAMGVNGFFQQCDISARPNTHPTSSTAASMMVANSLADLTQRENRFGHDPRVIGGSAPAFPYELSANTLNLLALTGNNKGEDIMLSHLKAFDVRVFDPTARVQSAGAGTGRAVVPGDVGWTLGGTAVGLGAFVDLKYNTSATSIFAKAPLTASASAGAWGNALYDTWSLDYEQDGINQDNDTNPLTGAQLIDEGTDGLDNDNVNGVDDVGERETTPPYPVALRGLQVRIRVYEPDTRQVRQIAVTGDFTPE